MRIRPYDASDAEAVSEIVRTTMQVSNAADYPVERLQPLIDYFSPAKVEQLSRERACVVAEEDGRLVGTASLDGDEIVTFFVRPEQQGLGVGSALLSALEATARAGGRAWLRVDASLTGVGFYERHGYRRTADVLGGTAGPQISMRKRLGESVPPRA